VYYAFNSTLDIAVLIDGTFTSSEFETVRQFLATFQDRFYVSTDLTRFATVQFSTAATTTFGFTRYSTNAMLRDAYTNLQQESTGSVRDLGAALTYTYNNVFSQRRIDAAWVYIRYDVHTFNGPFSGTTRVSRYQKGKTNLDFTEARASKWQWHQLGHMQVCTSLQTDNHASTASLSFITGRMPFLPPTQT